MNEDVSLDHFVNGKKSSDRLSMSYAPTIFPTKHLKEPTEQQVKRFERLQSRRQQQENRATSSGCLEEDDLSLELSLNLPSLRTTSSQTDPTLESFENGVQTQFFCDLVSPTEKATLAIIPKKVSQKIQVEPKTSTKSTSPMSMSVLVKDCIANHFLSESSSENKFRSLFGVSKNLFRFLCYKVEGSVIHALIFVREINPYFY
jgi:hypothetical protein